MSRAILLVKTSSLGDVIHNMPAASDIRAHWPDARIDWMVEEAYAPLVAMHRAVERVVPVAIRRWRKALLEGATWREIGAARKSLAGRTYDHVIDTQGLVKSALVARWARGRHDGFDAASAREPFACRLYEARHRVDKNLHATERCRLLVGAALGYLPRGPLDYGLARVDSHARGEPRVLLLHGTARREKEWPEASWQALGVSLARRGMQPVLLRGSAEEAARSERLAQAIDAGGHGGPPTEVAPRMALDALARLVATMRAVVGVDTGLMHLAAALGVPVAAIFVATEPGLTGPRGQGPIELLGGPGRVPRVDDVALALERLGGAPA